MSYTWPQDRDDYIPNSIDKMSDREDRSDSLQYITPDGYRRTDHVNYDKDLDWTREQTPDSETRGASRNFRRRIQDEKQYSMERSAREDSPVSAEESLHSEPISVQRREYRERRSSPRYAHTVNNGPTYTSRLSKHRKMSTASMDSQLTDTTLPDKQRSRSHSIDSINSVDSCGRTRTRSRRLSFAEGRALRRAVEKAEEEARENRRREKEKEKKRFYQKNREKARNLEYKEEESDEEVFAEDLTVGDIVLINRGVGVVRYVGRLHFKSRSDYWVGVELKGNRGKNSGAIKGKRYFTCKEGQGIFVSEVMKRISPEELLEQLALQRQKCKRVKKVLGQHKRERYQNDLLRSQVKTMEQEIQKLTRYNITNVASAVGSRMENFLNLLADNLTPGPKEHRRTPKTMLTVLDLPPSRSSDDKILDWLYRKKCNQNLSPYKQPDFDDKTVRRGMLWLIKTLQKEVKARRRQIDRRLEADRTRDYGDSDSE